MDRLDLLLETDSTEFIPKTRDEILYPDGKLQVRCIQTAHSQLTVGRIYDTGPARRSVGSKLGYSITNDSGHPGWYWASRFEVVKTA